MRVLSIGHPLPDAAIDNYSIFSAPTLFDYQAIVIDPAGVFAAIQEVLDGSGEQHTHADVPVVNGETGPLVTGAADVLRRRRDEVARALERGALVAVFAYPQATLPVSGFSGCDRYFFLPAPPGMGWDSALLRGGESTAVAVSDHAHPFAPVIDVLRTQVLSRAYFDDRAHGFAGAAKVFARSPGGAPLGVEFAVGGGRVVFLPAPHPRHDAPPLLASAIVQAMRDALSIDDAEPPYWLETQAVPGLEALETRLRDARERSEQAARVLREAQQEHDALAALRDVLWRDGDRLRAAVLRCCTLLGFQVGGAPEAPTLFADEGELLLEVAAAREAVPMAPHYRLRERLDRVIERERRAPRGLLVVNGERLRAPEARTVPWSDALRVAAESSRYALLTTPALFAAARCALELHTTDTRALAPLRRPLYEGAGPVSLASAVAALTREAAPQVSS